MTSLIGTPTYGEEAQRHDGPARTVSFPELVRLRYTWRQGVTHEDADSPDRGTEAADFHTALSQFEREHGRIVNAYWCSEIEAAVALTERPPTTSLLRRFGAPLRQFHRVSDYATRDQSEIARLLHQCDELSIRAGEVLGGRNERICLSLVMASAGHLLSLIDRPRPAETERRHAVDLEHHDFGNVQHYYRQAANGKAQLVYFAGMIIGMTLLFGMWLLVGRELEGAGVNVTSIVGCLTAGAIGALVSVISRINTGSFGLEFDVAPAYTMFLGSLRPWIGSMFGLLMYFAVTSGFLDLFKVPPEPTQRFYFLCVVAFLAGFSERWAQDTLTGGLGKRGVKPAVPPVKQSRSSEPPAEAAAD